MKTLNEHWESMPISIGEATLKHCLQELIKEGFLEGAENENAAYPFGSGPSRDGTQRNEIA